MDPAPSPQDRLNRMTAAQFRQLPPSIQPTELIEGVVIVAPSPIADHQRLVGRIYALLLALSPPGEPMIARMDVYLDDANVFQPDVFWRADGSRCLERDGYFYGPPELVVEVHSPAKVKADKRAKFKAYARHGVQEYWMIDPVGGLVEVWQRHGDSLVRLDVFSAGETFDSVALGRAVTLSGVFGDA